MENLWVSVSNEKIGPLKYTMEVIDPNQVLAQVKAGNAKGEYSLFCPNHIISQRKILANLPVNYFIAKEYFKKEWIPLVPTILVNHINMGGVVGDTINNIGTAFQKSVLKDTWYIPLKSTVGKKMSFARHREYGVFDSHQLGKENLPPNKNIWIPPSLSTIMFPSGKEDFIAPQVNLNNKKEVRGTRLASTFAKEMRFPWYDIVPVYNYEDKWGKFYMSVGNPIKKTDENGKQRNINDIKIEYLEAMQNLKTQTLKHIAEKKEK